jgi:sulfite exporter TauE/SafE
LIFHFEEVRMLVAFVLGLMGSLGHCVGMCSGVAVLLSRQGLTSGWSLLLVHLGRVTTYGLLGLVAGVLGQTVLLVLSYFGPAAGAGTLNYTVAALLPNLGRLLQGILAVTAAGMAGYLALALLGRVPSPELYLVKLTGRWGHVMRSLTGRKVGSSLFWTFLLGLIWGLLPCGLVLTALLAATVTSSPWQGAVTMLAFGLGTWPALLGAGLVTRLNLARAIAIPWPRQMAALVVLLFGSQLALRGLAAWGWVDHLRLGDIVVW